MLADDALLERLEVGFENAGLDDRRLAMLRYVDKLTRSPGQMERSDVESLRQNGFTDADILSVVEVAGYYAYVNRLADGLGVELEAEN